MRQTRLNSAFGSFCKLLLNIFYFIGGYFQIWSAGFCRHTRGGTQNACAVAPKAAVGNLCQNQATAAVYRFGDAMQSRNVMITPYSQLFGVHASFFADMQRLGNNQALSTGGNRFVMPHIEIGHKSVFIRPVKTHHCRKPDTIFDKQISNPMGFEKVLNENHLVSNRLSDLETGPLYAQGAAFFAAPCMIRPAYLARARSSQISAMDKALYNPFFSVLLTTR